MGVAVLVVILTVSDGRLRVLLIHRSAEPHQGMWALPGGIPAEGESLPDAASRKLREETGVSDVYLEQLFTFDGLDGDSSSVAVSYFALVDSRSVRLREEPNWEPQWFELDELPELAFNNAAVLETAMTRLRSKLEYTNVAYSLMPREFTLRDLQAVYESIYGRSFDKRNFRRRMISQGLIRPTGRTVSSGAHRPAELFEFTSRQPMAF
jgi:8-oxo-dGTP diphosphatase